MSEHVEKYRIRRKKEKIRHLMPNIKLCGRDDNQD